MCSLSSFHEKKNGKKSWMEIILVDHRPNSGQRYFFLRYFQFPFDILSFEYAVFFFWEKKLLSGGIRTSHSVGLVASKFQYHRTFQWNATICGKCKRELWNSSGQSKTLKMKITLWKNITVGKCNKQFYCIFNFFNKNELH